MSTNHTPTKHSPIVRPHVTNQRSTRRPSNLEQFATAMVNLATALAKAQTTSKYKQVAS